MDSTTNAVSARATDRLLGVLRSRWIGHVLNGIVVVLLVALFFRYYLGYIPRFFVVSLPIALAVFVTSLAAFIARPASRSAFSVLLSTAAAATVFVCAVSFSGILPPKAMQIYLSQQSAKPRIYVHSLPGDLDLFRNGVDKSGWKSFSDLPRLASDFHGHWQGELRRQGFSEAEARAASLMLFTSALWAFGNETHPKKVGCIPVNEDNNWLHQKPTFEVVKQTRIGCCTDYAHTLSYILSKNGYENRYLVIPGHIFNEARIDGKWYVLDANTNLMIDSAWNDTVTAPEKVSIHVFAHPGSLGGKLHRPLISAFQNYMVNMVLIGDFVKGSEMKGREPDPAYKITIDLLY